MLSAVAWIFALSSPRRPAGAARAGAGSGVALAALFLSAAAGAECGDGVGLYRQLSPSIVGIEAAPGGNIFERPRFGSGVVVAERLVVTANHVVAGTREVGVLATSGTRYAAQVLRHDPVADLALLSVGELGALPAVPLMAGDLQPGRCVAVLGSVMHAGFGMFCGTVSLIVPPEPSGLQGILTDISAPPGLSGGALVSCVSRRLAGIVTFGLVNLAEPRNTAGIVGAVPIAALLGLLSVTTARK